MAKRMYALRRGDKKTLKVEWKGNYKNLTLTLDGQVIGQIPDKQSLQAGRTFALPGGAKLGIILQKNKLNIARDGLALPGTPDDPGAKLTNASSAAVTVSILSVLALVSRIGGTSILGPSDPVTNTIAFILILVFFGLAYFIQKRQRWALWAALIIYGLDTALLLVALAQGGLAGFGFTGLIIRAIVFYYLFQGFGGIDGLEAEEATVAMREAKRRRQASGQPGVSNSGASPAPATNAGLSAAENSVKIPPPASADPVIHEAYRHIQAGTPQLGRANLASYMRQNPENAYGWYLASFVLELPAQQVGALQRALRYDPALTAAQERLAMLWNSQRELA